MTADGALSQEGIVLRLPMRDGSELLTETEGRPATTVLRLPIRDGIL